MRWPSGELRGASGTSEDRAALRALITRYAEHSEAFAVRLFAQRYLPTIARPWPGSAWLLETTDITKRRRTEYDHVMLPLHDRAKSDARFQRDSPQVRVDFAPGTTWVVFSDQVLHAAMGGQHMMEQTFYLDVEHLQRPQTSPLHTLERLAQRSLR